MRYTICLATALIASLAGCPLSDPAARYQSSLTAVITASTTMGEAPLQVTFSGLQSISAARIVKYTWDFAGQFQTQGPTAQYTFNDPGRYPVTLTVVDARGQQSNARIYITVGGGSVQAVITADKLSGPVPLVVSFDASASVVENDSILDYYWDFGDGATSRDDAPLHTYDTPGTFTVTLRVVTAGGAESTAQTTITAGEGAAASLQFDGSQYAALPVAPQDALAEFTFEAWIKPQAAGGTVVNFGSPGLAIDVLPGQQTISLRSGSQTLDVAASPATDRWQFVAVSYRDGEGAAVYLDGLPLGTLDMSGTFAVSTLNLGAGFVGKIARVRFWSTARDAAQVASDQNADLTGFEEGLLGDWLLDEGSGQTLANNASGGASGTRGPTDDPEASDPAWSSDAP